MILFKSFGIVLFLGAASLAYDEGLLKSEIKEGILKLTHDFENGNIHEDVLMAENILGYFPKEIAELAPQVTRYFMGKEKGSTTTKRTKDLACIGCQAGVDVLNELFSLGVPASVMKLVGGKLCSLALDESVCTGMIDHFLPELEYIADHGAMNGAHFCALCLGGKCGAWEDLYGWEVDFPDTVPKPPYVPPTPPKENSPTTKVLHLSDVHLDLSYQIGTTTDCGLPMCCMNSTEMADDASKAAGYWGAYYCDSPVWMFENMLSQIQEQFGDEIDYIMFTGDFPAHDVWLQSKDENRRHGKVATDLVKKYFPETTVITNIGNHEPFPVNSMPLPSVDDPKFSASWIYEYLGEYFAQWLPEEAKLTFSDHGFFTYQMKPGFRIVSLNTILNLGYNFWTNLDYKDPGGSLLWLWDVLLKAEEANEKVHIIGHSPPNTNEFVSGWAKQYTKLIDRFANTVTGQFYGHTHNDEFTMFYDYDTNKIPINMAYVTPSVTPFTGLNPSFRFYTLDGPYEGASMRVLDVDTYIFNLTDANLSRDKQPEYFKLYNHRNDLEMENLFPADFDELAHRMKTDDATYNKFFRYFNSDSFGEDLDRRSVVCKMVSSVFVDDRKCKEIMG